MPRNQCLQLPALRVFAKVVEEGGLPHAARALDT